LAAHPASIGVRTLGTGLSTSVPMRRKISS
jgi:hypothetical protein